MGCTNAPSSKRHILQSSNPIIRQYLAMMQFDNTANVNNRYEHISRLCLNQSIGVGLRKTCTYDCLITRDEMIAQRREFWETRTNGKSQCWALLKELIQTQFDDAIALKRLKDAGVIALDDSYMMCLDKGMIKYDIPVFCINEARSYSAKRAALNNLKNSYVQQPITIKFRSARNGSDIVLNLPSTSMPIQQIKELYRSSAGLSATARIRFFFSGRELTDDVALGNYNVRGDSVIQAMITGV